MELNPIRQHRHFVARMIGYGLGLYIVLIIFTTLWHLPVIRRLPIGASTNIGLGPFTILQVHKAADGSGFAMTITAKSGMVWLLACCLAVELALAWVTIRAVSHAPPDDKR